MTAPTWSPQPRPAWVSTLNTVGTNVGSEAVVPLDAPSLLAAACATTGLEDFGGDEWREPFNLLVSDLARADLTLTGRLLARIDILRSLKVRLHLAQTEAEHPEILEQPIEAPIFITGLGRTGTSILVELIGQDPALRPGLGWEFRYPSPPPISGPSDPARVARATADLDLWEQVIPELPAIHETVIDGPDEDSMAQLHVFTSPIWSAVHDLPAFEAWNAADRNVTALRHHRRMLQHLQWKKPGRFILKNPSLLSTLPSVFAEFPDAHIVMTHRDPMKVMASSADMLATLRWQRCERVGYPAIAQKIVAGYPMLLDWVSAERDSGSLPPGRVHDVLYADLIADHTGTIAKVYEELGLTLTSDAADRMRDYLANKPRDRHGARSYRFEDLGADTSEIRKQLSGYMARFNVPEEQ